MQLWLFMPSFKGRWRKTACLFCDGRFFVAKQRFTARWNYNQKKGDNMPDEKYSFNFTDKEVKEFLKQVTNHKKGLIQQICWIIIFFGLILLAYLSGFVFTLLKGIFIGILIIYCLLLILTYYRTKKILKYWSLFHFNIFCFIFSKTNIISFDVHFDGIA